MKLSQTDQILVRACLVDSDEAERLFVEWDKRIVWDRLDSGSMRLLPLLYQKLVGREISGLTFARLERIFRQSLLHGLTQEAAAIQSLSRFRSEGIPFAVLKGFALRQQFYTAGNATRPIHDLDVLIHKADFDSAQEILESLGMTPEFIVDKTYNLSYRKEALFRGNSIDFDVHWRILELTSSRNFDTHLWSHTASLTVKGLAVEVLNLEASLFHVISHSVGWNSVKNLNWIIDSVKIIQTESFDWDKFARLCHLSGWHIPVSDRLTFLQSFASFNVPQAPRTSGNPMLSSLQTNLMIKHLRTSSRLLRRVQRFFYAESLHSGEIESLSSLKGWIRLQILALFRLLSFATRSLRSEIS